MPGKLITPLGKAAQANASKIILNANGTRSRANDATALVIAKSNEFAKMLAAFDKLLTAILSGKQNAAKYIAYINTFIDGDGFDLEQRGLLTKLVAFMSGPPMSAPQIADALNMFYWSSDETVWNLDSKPVKDFMMGLLKI